MAGSVLNEWPLAKYARFVQVISKKTEDFSGNKPNLGTSVSNIQNNNTTDKGLWQHFTGSESEPLKISLLSSSHLIIMRGQLLLESHQLMMNSGLIRAAGKGDSIMFVVKVQNEERRFRIRFSDSGTGTEAQRCAEALRAFIAIEYSKSDGSKEISLPQAARKVLSGSAVEIYKNLEMTDEDASTLLHLCLTDSTFPDFVQQIEEKLKNIINPGNENIRDITDITTNHRERSVTSADQYFTSTNQKQVYILSATNQGTSFFQTTNQVPAFGRYLQSANEVSAFHSNFKQTQLPQK